MGKRTSIWVALACALGAAQSGSAAADDQRLLSFGSQQFDPVQQAESFRVGSRNSQGQGLRLVQLEQSPEQDHYDRLQSAGLRVLQYYPHNAYLVWGDDLAASRAGADSAVRWHGLVSPDWKLAPELKGRLGPINNVAVLIYDDGQLPNVLAQIAGLGASVRSHAPAQPDAALVTAIVSIDAGQLALLNALPQVLWTEYASPVPGLEDEMSSQIVAGNYNASNQVIGTGYLPFIQNLGLSGAGVTFAVTDTGVDYDNPEFAGRIVGGHDYPGCTSAAGRPGDDKSTGGHGTHVAGIVGGAGVIAGGTDANGYHYGIGIAPAVNLVTLNPICGGSGGSWPPAGGWQELSRRALLLGAMGSNNSWTSGEGTGIGYNASARTHDFIVRDGNFDTPTSNEPFLLVFSAGNSGSGASTITAPKEAKNIISTASSLNQRAGSIENLAGSSSRGPAVDGRILPTITAPGSSIAATRRVAGASQCGTAIGGGVLANYAFCSGTSMASPHAAGLAVLLTEWWRGQFAGATPSPAMLKALLVNGAVDITGPPAIPNNAEGWGRIHLPRSIGVGVVREFVDQTVVLDNVGEVFERAYGVPDSAQPVRITLNWTDAPGAAGANPALVNNLDLEVVAGGQTYRGNVFSGGVSVTGGSADNRATTENVYLPPGVSDVLVRVRATTLPGNGVPNFGDATDQDFALVCSNCAAQPSFTMATTPVNESVCAGEVLNSTMSLGQILGFSDPVTMSSSGLPAPGTVGFNPNPVVTLPGSTQVTMTTAGVAAGAHTVQLIGTSGSTVRSVNMPLFIATAAPGAASLTTPANGATNVPVNTGFVWAAGTQAYDYEVQIATDVAFTNIIASTETRDGNWTPSQSLPSNSQLHWRVIARNACASGAELFADGFETGAGGGGSGTVSATGSFSTQPLPGDCPIGTATNVVYSENMESGAGPLPPNWTSSAGTGTNSWTMNTFAPNSGLRNLQSLTPTSTSDQRVETPSIALPAAAQGLSLVFWQRHNMEPRTGGCWDGGLLEVSVGGGAFTPITSGIANPPYDGPFGSGNPAAPLSGWCGTRPYIRTAVDLSPYANQSVRIRFRTTSDGSVNLPDGWIVDDIVVQQCQ